MKEGAHFISERVHGDPATDTDGRRRRSAKPGNCYDGPISEGSPDLRFTWH